MKVKAELVTAICNMLVWTVENVNESQGICWHLGDYQDSAWAAMLPVD